MAPAGAEKTSNARRPLLPIERQILARHLFVTNTRAHTLHAFDSVGFRSGGPASAQQQRRLGRIRCMPGRAGGLLRRGPPRGVDAPSLGRGPVVSPKRSLRSVRPRAPRVVCRCSVAGRPPPVFRAASAPARERERALAGKRPVVCRHALAEKRVHRETVVSERGPPRRADGRDDARNLSVGIR